MATYSSSVVTSNTAYSPVGPKPRIGEYGVTAAIAGTADDLIQLIPVSKGETLIDLALESADLDSSTAIEISVGDSLDDNRFIASSTIAQAGGIVRQELNLGYSFTQDDNITVKIETAAGTGVAGTIKMVATLL